MNTSNKEAERLDEFRAAFSVLDEPAREAALNVLRALEFAQNVAIVAASDISQLNMGAVAV